ncbi:MAG: hypothetical protein ABI811_08345 [Acidobacteriota bacterium]
MTKEQLYAEIEDIIRTMPSQTTIREQNGQNSAWFGRAFAAIEKWSPFEGPLANFYYSQFLRDGKMQGMLPLAESNQSADSSPTSTGLTKLVTLLHKAHSSLRFDTVGPATLVVPHKMVFEYFEELRKIITLAKQDLLFVDPYLDADFVSRYLPHVDRDVSIRLLAREKLPSLRSAVEIYFQQTGYGIQIRSAPHFHDRYVFVDRVSCYQSGASFKDGAKSAPTTITQITDAHTAVLQTYEEIWASAQVVR